MHTHFIFYFLPFLFSYFFIFYFFIFYSFIFWDWAQRSPHGWAGPSRPCRATGLTRLAIVFFTSKRA
jgi:hypothetical protein